MSYDKILYLVYLSSAAIVGTMLAVGYFTAPATRRHLIVRPALFVCFFPLVNTVVAMVGVAVALLLVLTVADQPRDRS